MSVQTMRTKIDLLAQRILEMQDWGITGSSIETELSELQLLVRMYLEATA